jgi:hypothetical protein
MLASADFFELAVQLLFRHALWVALIVFLRVFLLPGLKNIRQGWPVKHLREKQNRAQCGGRRTKARILFSAPSLMPPLGSAQQKVREHDGNR